MRPKTLGTFHFTGLLFDLDGTLIDSTSAVNKHWNSVATEIGVNPQVILQTTHGRRTIDTLEIFCPQKANWENVRQMEALIPELYGKEATEIPGARTLLNKVINARVPWAIVTSGSAPLATGWLDVMGFPRPTDMITAESVEHGKPDPACFMLGFERLQLASEISEVVAFEDSPAGIQSAKAAGCRTIGLVTSHTLEEVVAAGPDWVVNDLKSVEFVDFEDGIITLQLSNVLYSK